MHFEDAIDVVLREGQQGNTQASSCNQSSCTAPKGAKKVDCAGAVLSAPGTGRGFHGLPGELLVSQVGNPSMALNHHFVNAANRDKKLLMRVDEAKSLTCASQHVQGDD